MKLKIAAAALLVISLSSCKKDFLRVTSETSLSTPIFFKTQADFQQAVNGAYAPLRTLYNTAPSGGGANQSGAWVMGEMHSDNAHYILNPSYRATTDQENIANFIYEPASGTATTKYTTDYQIIARANQVLDPIDAVDFDAAVKSNIKGQALFLRAFAYFDLVQYFGKVPLHLKPVLTLEETALPPASTDSIYARIVADAKQAAALLPGKKVQEAGRATSGAAKTLLANVYMVLKQWSNAEAVLKEVVSSGDYSLLSDYAAVFDTKNKNHAESVFEVQFQEGAEGYNSNFIYRMLPYPMTASAIGALTGVSNPQALSEGEGMNTPTPDLIAAYEPGDKRKDASIGSVTASNGVTYPFVKKYLHAHTLYNNSNDNWPVYRYAEVLLLLAEALNEQGRSADALTYVNMVHAHTRTGLAPIGPSSQSQLRDGIARERRVELAFENKRWLDLVRTGKAVEVISAYGAKVKANPQAYYYPAGYFPPSAAFTNISTVFPLPSSEALLSPYF